MDILRHRILTVPVPLPVDDVFFKSYLCLYILVYANGITVHCDLTFQYACYSTFSVANARKGMEKRNYHG